jgi:hypothetical protein
MFMAPAFREILRAEAGESFDLASGRPIRNVDRE